MELESADQLSSCQTTYDILFLDIRFGNQNLGIDVAESLRAQGNTSIIMILLKAMSLEGYRAEPFRFLLKPLTENQIHARLSALPMKNTIIKKNHFIQSTEKDPAQHGLGLKNMERAISRYGGHMDIEYTIDEFSLVMAIPVPPEA